MKVLFAVSSESVSGAIIKKYQQMYKEIILSKNVYYFNAIIKELQKDKTYDRVVISEDLEPFTNNNYETIDNFIFEKLDNISDEATTNSGKDIPIILIAADRRSKSDNLLVKLFGIGIYSALIGQDRSTEELCKLIQKPRTKKEAKLYYKIDSNDVDYKPENEGEVSETEIQNILSYFKRLGRNEERYVESFDSVAAQYTDQQLRVIINCLPLNVRAVLEENSPRYQQIVSFGDNKNKKTNNYHWQSRSKTNNNTTKAIGNDGIKVESITSGERKLTKPVIIPSASRLKKVQNTEQTIKVEPKTQKTVIEEKDINNYEEEKDAFDEPMLEESMIGQEPKKGRGRPKKMQLEGQNEQENLETKRGRGRPKKVDILSEFEENEEDKTSPEDEKIEDTTLPGFEDFEEDATLPGFEDSKEETTLPGFEDLKEDATLPDFEKNQEDNYQSEDENGEDILPGFEIDDDEGYDETEENDNEVIIPDVEKSEEDKFYNEENDKFSINQSEENNNDDFFANDKEDNSRFFQEDQQEEEMEPESQLEQKETFEPFSRNTDLQDYQEKDSGVERLLTNNQKIVAFVGTSKNGTSFLVNNLAEMISKQGIRTAILDLTKNKNSYYIYTKNEENLRKVAFDCMEKLVQGTAQGIKVNNNLDVYTALPGEDEYEDNYQEILSTLVQNYSLILIDCDFKTNYAYLKEAQEIYLVQSMDVLTIQPLTAYLRELKAKGILEQNKLKAVINKYTRVRGITEKAIIGGMAFYNDPAMAYMTELFNRETIPYCTIPFDSQTYAKYLEALINCEISINGYSKELINNMKKLASMVYPLISGNTKNKGKDNNPKYNNPKYNKFAGASGEKFSDNMNSTLDKMRKNY